MLVIILLAFGLSLELATAGASGPVGDKGPRAVYHATWWLPPALVAGGGLYLAVALADFPLRTVGGLGGITALAFAIAFPLQTVPPGSERLPRRSISRDANRARRVAGVFIAALVVGVVAGLGGVLVP